MKKKIFTFIVLSSSSLAFGEYRVYQYYVRSKIQNITPQTTDLVTSTLNPITYIAYHGGNESVEVNLLRSWQCMGNTSNLPVCSISEGKELSEPVTSSIGVTQ